MTCVVWRCDKPLTSSLCPGVGRGRFAKPRNLTLKFREKSADLRTPLRLS